MLKICVREKEIYEKTEKGMTTYIYIYYKENEKSDRSNEGQNDSQFNL